ncbi:phosphoinositide phosphatase SAC2-like [Phoenix dactylifera]|uniref:Phosphoinositide phosphatase SAC2-like n=1 Tax=Phoenix dactylifera TaxID=42345 RepID=A0A8B9B386_PHODC|nr:phosphoinositide phosphatase SAC2-like [Phoenix dactylifera]
MGFLNRGYARVLDRTASESEVEWDWSAAAAAEAEADAGSGYLQKFGLYETVSKFYMVGRDKSRRLWRVLTIDRLEPCGLNISEDPTVYSEIECYDMLNRIHDGNKSTGGLKFVTRCYGIVGFFKFLGPYYMLLITRRRKIGTICGHAVFAVAKSETIALPHSTVGSDIANSKDENRFLVYSECEKCVMSLVFLMDAVIISVKQVCHTVSRNVILLNFYSSCLSISFCDRPSKLMRNSVSD